jgi:protein TonB
MTSRTVRLVRLAIPLALCLAVPGLASAQQDVYGPSDLTTAPKLVSAAATARLIARSYPEGMRRQSQGGEVKMEFVIGKDGRVEPSTISVLESSAPALGNAAKSVVEKMEFVPGKKDGQPVRARVQLPIVYKP